MNGFLQSADIRDCSQTLVMGGDLMQKGGLKILEVWKEGAEKKNHANFTPKNLVYMIFCGVDWRS